MIAYHLACAEGHEFEGWFASSGAYADQEANGELCCPLCGNGSVRKAVMAPAVNTGRGREPAEPAPTYKQYAAGVRKFVEDNAEYVGSRFPEEARKIHYGETEQRHIYGESTLTEAKELLEEGIDIAPLPVDPDDLN